ncbi:MAG TPA: hypothetical protein VMS09_04715 [Paenibacillus sp.]|uniref:hypothetical protein n=1 Tax=Paenibacillus sp. TaxID=58172 RepID=UPI002BD445A4|nr:hypothetical protein [Paenibacillus sp.]HUC91318.1 hypothetical protein [Paenibacillus sp.]
MPFKAASDVRLIEAALRLHAQGRFALRASPGAAWRLSDRMRERAIAFAFFTRHQV